MAAAIFALVFAARILGGFCALTFSTYYGNHMVLQRGPQSSIVWGHATKIGDTVTVTVSRPGGTDIKATGSVVHNAHGTDGIWKVKLPPVTDSTHAYVITATSSEGTVKLTDVFFGDVWLCSGQSNMGFVMKDLINSTYELQKAKQFTNVRYLNTNQFTSNVPLTDPHQISPWTTPNDGLQWFSAVCWLFGEYLYSHIKVPIGLVETQWGGTPIEAWSSPDALAACHSTGKRQTPNTPSVLYNAMIYPYLPQTIYGAIWYQGEANAGNPDAYACQFPAMIKDWRQKFHDASLGTTSLNFPFGFVQLAPFNSNPNNIGGFPPTRWAQTAKYGYVPNDKMPNTFMAVAMDLPDFNAPTGSIHPRYKQDVAARLVLGARAVAYKENVVFQGAFPQHLTPGTNILTVTYNNAHQTTRNKNGFEVCCSAAAGHCAGNDPWVAAPITGLAGNKLTLDTSACASTKHVTALRYEWRESPCQLLNCALYDSVTGLPSPPFLLNVPL